MSSSEPDHQIDTQEPDPSSSTGVAFKKRNRARPTTRTKVQIEPQTQSGAPESTDDTANDGRDSKVDGEEETVASLDELLLLRSLHKRPTGIDLNRLNAGEKKKKKKKEKDAKEMTEEEKWQEKLNRGGLIDPNGEAEEEEEGDEEENTQTKPRLVRQDNFQGETNTVDVDKHMMAYIESEMAKRNPSKSNSSSTSAPTSDEIQKVLNDPEDDLYRVAEKYRILQQQAKPKKKMEDQDEDDEGNVGTSAMMLSGIPEIDLGMEARLKNIEETEKAKKLLYEQKRNRTFNPSQSREADEALANARFFRGGSRREPQSDSDALARARGQMPAGKGGDAARGNGNGNGNGGGKGRDRRDMASDELVMGRFKKRQRANFK